MDYIERINLGLAHVIKQNIIRIVIRSTNLALDANYDISIGYLNISFNYKFLQFDSFLDG